MKKAAPGSRRPESARTATRQARRAAGRGRRRRASGFPALSMPLASLPGRPARRGSGGSPVRVLAGQPEDQDPDVPASRWPAGPAAPGPGGPAAADDVTMPAQDRVRGDQQPHPVAACPGYQAEQGREQRPVCPVQVRSAWLASLQHGELMAQDQDLGGLPCLPTPGQICRAFLIQQGRAWDRPEGGTAGAALLLMHEARPCSAWI